MKIILVFFTILLCYCTSNKKPKPKILFEIRGYMKENLNDYSSYQPIETVIDSAFEELTSENLTSKRFFKISREDSLLRIYRHDLGRYKNVNDSITKSENEKKIFYGWSIDHKFRAKNSFGALILNHFQFIMDVNFNIVNVVDWNADVQP